MQIKQGPAVVSFISELTIVMVSIYLPYRAFQLGADSWLVGLIGASGSVIYMFAPFLTGGITDRVGPKRLLVVGSLVIAGICALYTTVTTPVAFIALRVVEGFGWAMIWPPLEALYSMRGPDLARSMKMFNLAWGIGAIVGPLVGSILVGAVAVTGTLAASAVLMLVAFVMSLATKEGEKTRGAPAAGAVKGLGIGRYAMFLPYTFVYGFTFTTISTFFPKFAAGLQLGVAIWGITLSTVYAGRLVAFYLSQRIMGSLGAKRTRQIFLVASLCFPLYSVLPGMNAGLLIASSFVTGVGFGLVYSATLVEIMSGPAEERGRAAGLFESSLGLGSFVGPAVAGALGSSGLWLTMAIPVAPILLVVIAGKPIEGSKAEPAKA